MRLRTLLWLPVYLILLGCVLVALFVVVVVDGEDERYWSEE